MFVDEVKIEIIGGKGGNGIVAYRRELKVERGGPFGGSGGKGGNVIFIGDEGLLTLLDLRYNARIKGNAGENGRNKGMLGANAKNTYVKVPLGTSIFENSSGLLIGDITNHKQEVIVCLGGRGGRGNMSFASGSNKCPDICEKGEPGEIKEIRCELKVLADCGLVGFPSVGKSTIISAVSAARPRIASYHFTTLVPNLGMVQVADGRGFVMADLPGIIEGASEGAGLGLRFLRHIERCKVIVHVIDMAGSEGRDPYDDYLAINEELRSYKMNLSKRPQIIVANKMDLPEAQDNLVAFKEKLSNEEIIAISAYTKENTEELIYKIADLLDKTASFSLFESDEAEEELFVNYVFKASEKMFEIEKESEGVFVITGDGLKKIVEMTDFNRDASIARFARQLRSFGVDDALRKKGAKDGDLIVVFNYEFEFVE